GCGRIATSLVREQAVERAWRLRVVEKLGEPAHGPIGHVLVPVVRVLEAQERLDVAGAHALDGLAVGTAAGRDAQVASRIDRELDREHIHYVEVHVLADLSELADGHLLTFEYPAQLAQVPFHGLELVAEELDIDVAAAANVTRADRADQAR